MPPTAPLNRQQQWMYRHRRGVRIGCVAFLAVLVVSAIDNFAEHHVWEGMLSILVCFSALSLILVTKSLERTADLQAGLDTEPG